MENIEVIKRFNVFEVPIFHFLAINSRTLLQHVITFYIFYIICYIFYIYIFYIFVLSKYHPENGFKKFKNIGNNLLNNLNRHFI